MGSNTSDGLDGILRALDIPESTRRPRVGDSFPQAVFAAEQNGLASTADWHEKGPLLLVFFRGFW